MFSKFHGYPQNKRPPHLPDTRLALGFILLNLTPFDLTCGVCKQTLVLVIHGTQNWVENVLTLAT